MPRALWMLLGLRSKAYFRRIGRGLKTPRGVLFFVFGVFGFMMWLLPTIFNGLVSNRVPIEPVRQAAPLAMLGVSLLMILLSGGKVISFMPAEVDFLFAGPFSRRSIVVFKVVGTAIGALFASLMFSAFLWRYSPMWISGFLGLWFNWLLAQSLAMTLLVGKQALLERTGSSAARLVVAAGILAVAAGVIEIASPLFQGTFDLAALAAHARQTLVGRALLAPFEVISRVFTAERLFPDLLQWSAAAAALCGIAIAALLMLDGHFIETSIAASQTVQARLSRLRKGGGGVIAFGASPRAGGRRLPVLPWLGGAGPLAWRQLTIALRSSRGLLFVLLMLVMAIGPVLWILRDRQTSMMAPLLIAPAFWLTLLLPSMLRLDFRGDLQHMDVLKGLPIRPLAVATGQILAPVIVLTLVDGAIIGIAAAIIEPIRPWLLAALAFVPPLNFLLIGMENAMFLLFPTRQMMATPGDFQMVGRSAVISMLKMLALMAALGITAGVAALAWFLTASAVIGVVAAWVILAGAAAAMPPVIARLFRSFDPSVDIPA